METRYNYGPANNAAGYNPGQLDGEIRAAITLSATVLNVLGSGFLQGSIICPNVVIAVNPDITPAQKTALDGVIAAHVPGGPRRVRPAAAIYQDLILLTATQQNAIIADLGLNAENLAGKWAGMKPPQDGPAAALFWGAASLSGATALEKRKAAAWVAAMWCQQNPKYMVNPTFHASLAGVVIPGDEPAP